MRRPGYIGTDRFEVLLALLMAMFLLVPVFQEARFGAVAIGFLVLLVLISALVASGLQSRSVVMSAGLGGVVLLATVGGALATEGSTPAWIPALFAVVLVGTTVLVLRRILHHRQVTLRTVAGALCAYLMVGLAFGAVYRTVSVLDVDAFSEGLGSASTYYSFVTLTTLGYGDITPVSDLARSLAVIEAVLGQVLLVVLVARFVTTLGQTRQRPARREVDNSAARVGDDSASIEMSETDGPGTVGEGSPTP